MALCEAIQKCAKAKKGRSQYNKVRVANDLDESQQKEIVVFSNF